MGSRDDEVKAEVSEQKQPNQDQQDKRMKIIKKVRRSSDSLCC